jgi:hypothetical protein
MIEAPVRSCYLDWWNSRVEPPSNQFEFALDISHATACFAQALKLVDAVPDRLGDKEFNNENILNFTEVGRFYLRSAGEPELASSLGKKAGEAIVALYGGLNRRLDPAEIREMRDNVKDLLQRAINAARQAKRVGP